MKLTTQQLGRLGELLVQYELLQRGVESAAMTTDAGIDLVAYPGYGARSSTIQVKTNLKPNPARGRGQLAVGWWVDDSCPAELIAAIDLESRRTWLFTAAEFQALAQQHPPGRRHLYFYVRVNSEQQSKAYQGNGDDRYAKVLCSERRIHELFKKSC